MRRSWILPVAAGVLGVLIGAGGMAALSANRAAATERADQAARVAAERAVSDAAAARAAVLTGAVASCGLTTTPGIELGDGGTSLTFDTKGNEDASGAAITDIACIFDRLKMPSAVTSHIDQTTAMDGRQTETWGNVTVSWSYHPDRGLDGVLTVTNS
ncbi:hypothetical protein [Cellulomonas sp. P24]|uniref:hypothetical protein n=1 Tax=Cellulomonas sp. P24 TaxID=2885206 RepID=UPI00216B2C6C|nr:hypothetical protein [Cellulomonas sp. P24]MCR6492719.1 hypothetical protein [Cellulomonas sp. P24]